jgi:hypothetical protein
MVGVLAELRIAAKDLGELRRQLPVARTKREAVEAHQNVHVVRVGARRTS